MLTCSTHLRLSLYLLLWVSLPCFGGMWIYEVFKSNASGVHLYSPSYLTHTCTYTHTHTHTYTHTRHITSHITCAHRLNRVCPLATTQGISHKLSRNQHGETGLSATGRLPHGIVHDVQQELSTGSGVQLLREQPVWILCVYDCPRCPAIT